MNGYISFRIKYIMCLSIMILSTSDVMGETSKEEILSQIAEAHRKIQNVHVIFSDRVGEQVNTYEWAKEGEKEYRKKRFDVNYDVPEGEDKRWGKCMWDGKLLRHYGSAADNGAIRTKYDRYTSPSVTWNPYCRNFGTLMGDTVLSLIEKLPAEDWDVKYDETGKIVILSTDDVNAKGIITNHWHIDLNKGYMISRYRVDLKTREGVKTVSDMTVLEWKDMGNGIWLPWKSKTIGSLPGKPVREYILTVAKAEVNDESIESFFTDFEWPRGCQYYDETLGATVIPHATDQNMEKTIDEYALQAVDDIDSKLPATSNVETTTPASREEDSLNPSQPIEDEKAETSNLVTSQYWIYIALGIVFVLLVSTWLWKRYGRGKNVSV